MLRKFVAATAASIMTFCANAAVAATYQITVSGTLQQTVITKDGDMTLTSDNVFSSAFGKSFQMTWSAPLDTVLDPSNPSAAGDFSTVYDGAIVPKWRPDALAGLRVSQSDTSRSVRLFTNLPTDAFGGDVLDFNRSLSISALLGDYDPYVVSYKLPRDLSKDVYELGYMQFIGDENVRKCTNRYCYNTVQRYIGYASIDSAEVSVHPSPVPLPAGLPLLVAGLGVMGYVGHRKKAQKA